MESLKGVGDANLAARDIAIDTAGYDADGVYGAHTETGDFSLDVRDGSVATVGLDSQGIVGVHLGVGAAGVFLAGGGRVAVGPRGRLGAASGVAIQASGGAPRLAVEMDLNGRRAARVLQDGAIRNDGGETTVVVNGVTLHEGAGGATGARAPNGAWDVSLSASKTIAGRIFAPEDFIESYAPRAAVYEALPGFLLRLDGGRPSGTRIARPGSSAWARVSSERGSYEPGRASVGAAYDFRRFPAEAGLEFALGGNLAGSLSLRHVQGSAEVDSPHGGGEIEAESLGAVAGLSWSGADGYYARAAGVHELRDGRLVPGSGEPRARRRARARRRGDGGRGFRRAPRIGSVRHPRSARAGRDLAQGAALAGRTARRERPGVRRHGIFGPGQPRLDVLGEATGSTPLSPDTVARQHQMRAPGSSGHAARAGRAAAHGPVQAGPAAARSWALFRRQHERALAVGARRAVCRTGQNGVETKQTGAGDQSMRMALMGIRRVFIAARSLSILSPMRAADAFTVSRAR